MIVAPVACHTRNEGRGRNRLLLMLLVSWAFFYPPSIPHPYPRGSERLVHPLANGSVFYRISLGVTDPTVLAFRNPRLCLDSAGRPIISSTLVAALSFYVNRKERRFVACSMISSLSCLVENGNKQHRPERAHTHTLPFFLHTLSFSWRRSLYPQFSFCQLWVNLAEMTAQTIQQHWSSGGLAGFEKQGHPARSTINLWRASSELLEFRV